MKFYALISAMLLSGSIAFAQNDPTVMTINGKPVTRSEFEYSYNKNNSNGVIDKKTVKEYVDLFVNVQIDGDLFFQLCRIGIFSSIGKIIFFAHTFHPFMLQYCLASFVVALLAEINRMISPSSRKQ